MTETNLPISARHVQTLVGVVVARIRDAQFKPDTILALSTGGFPVAAALAKRLGVPSQHVVGLPLLKDADGDYHFDERLVTLASLLSGTFLVVDEAADRGRATRMAVERVNDRGGRALSCVLIAREDGIQPDFVGQTWVGTPPPFYWEADAAFEADHD